jgi:hypothetical protein
MFKVPVQIGKTIVLGRNFLNTIGWNQNQLSNRNQNALKILRQQIAYSTTNCLRCSVFEKVRNNCWLEVDQIKKEMKLKDFLQKE